MSAAEKAGENLTVALPKGRVFGEAVEILRGAGLLSRTLADDDRVLVNEDAKTGLRVLTLRNTDVPTYVERGAAELGIIGKDVLLEQNKEVYEPLDLGFAPCRMMVAAPNGVRWKELEGRMDLRVASKFPGIAARFFEAEGIPVQVIRLYGNVEIAPAAGVADVIVDLVDTGGTLRANGLSPVREIFRATARLIVNRAALKTRPEQISRFISLVKKASARKKKSGKRRK